MISPDEFDALATRLVGGAEERYIATLTEQLVATFASGGTLNSWTWRDIEEMAQVNHQKLQDLTIRFRTSIDRDVEAAVNETLKASAADDAMALASQYGPAVKMAGVTRLYERISAQTVEGVQSIIARQNIALAESAERLWYEVASDAVTAWDHGTSTMDTIMRTSVERLSREGLTVIDYKSGQHTSIDAAIRRHAVSQIGQASGRITMGYMTELGHDLVYTSAHMGARPEHEVWQGKAFSLSGAKVKDGVFYPDFYQATGYGTVTGLLGVNCVVGETLVSGPRPCAGYRREYTGELVIIRTAGGKELTITPNHPILTSKGWVAAGLLVEGDDVICRRTGGRAALGGPYVDDVPAEIQEVFRALMDRGTISRLPISTVDFHGDGIPDSEVESVHINGFLDCYREASAGKQGMELSLGCRTELPRSLLSKGTLAEILTGALHATDSVVCRLGVSLPFLRSHAGVAGTNSIIPVLGRVPVLGQPLADDHVPGSHLHGDSVLGYTGLVEPDDLGIIKGETPRNNYSTLFQPGNNHGPGNSELFADPISAHARAVEPDGFVDIDSDTLRTASIALNPGAMEGLNDTSKATTENIGYFLMHHPGLTKSDRIINVDRVHTTAHVYNLQTETGWYFANDILTHNCRHSFGPYIPGLSQLPELPDKIHGMDSSEFYDQTQKQRAYERDIRRLKKDIALGEKSGLDMTQKRLELGRKQAKLKALCDEKKLVRQYQREKAYAIGAQPRALRAARSG